MAMRGASTSGTGAMEGIRGIKHLGTRELTYRLCFLASAVQTEVSAAGTVGSVNGGDDMGEPADGCGGVRQRGQHQSLASVPDERRTVLALLFLPLQTTRRCARLWRIKSATTLSACATTQTWCGDWRRAWRPPCMGTWTSRKPCC